MKKVQFFLLLATFLGANDGFSACPDLTQAAIDDLNAGKALDGYTPPGPKAKDILKNLKIDAPLPGEIKSDDETVCVYSLDPDDLWLKKSP